MNQVQGHMPRNSASALHRAFPPNSHVAVVASSLKRDKTGIMLLLVTSCKLHTRFRPVPTSTTLNGNAATSSKLN